MSAVVCKGYRYSWRALIGCARYDMRSETQRNR